MTTATQNPRGFAKLPAALPFFGAFLLIPLFIWCVRQGGAAPLLVPLMAWYSTPLLDAAFGKNTQSADPETPVSAMTAHRLVTLIWWPAQVALLIWALIYTTNTPGISAGAALATFFALGAMSGTIGIVFSHELLHQPSKIERWVADLQLASVLYSHFRSEHLLVHHQHVGTPRDTVTAPYGEGFWRFFMRVVPQGLKSAWRAETSRLHKSDRQSLDGKNPFWRYWGLQMIYVLAAITLGGWFGLGLFVFQAFVAIWQLEVINYIEHYGLTRKKLGAGRYERQASHHSWDNANRATNWFLINLQRHSDHHMHPNRRYPVLQHAGAQSAPQLPCGYAVMGFLALVPPLWRKRMNPRVKRWRAMYYPEITDWTPYNRRQFRA